MNKQQAGLFDWVEFEREGGHWVRVTRVCLTYKDGRLPVWRDPGHRRPRVGDVLGMYHEGGAAYVVAPKA